MITVRKIAPKTWRVSVTVNPRVVAILAALAGVAITADKLWQAGVVAILALWLWIE